MALRVRGKLRISSRGTWRAPGGSGGLVTMLETQSGGCGGRRGAGGEQRGRSTELRSAGTGACCGHQLPRPEDAAIEGFEFQLPRPSPLRLLHDTGPFLQGGLEEEAKRRLPCLAWSWALRSPTSVSAAGRMLASAGQGHWFQPSGRPHK